jgi:hypothetical protein
MASFDEQIIYYKIGEKEIILISRFVLDWAKLEHKISLLLADFTRKWNKSIPHGQVKPNILKKFTEHSEVLKDQHQVSHENLSKLGHEILEKYRVNYPKNAFGNLQLPNILIPQYKKVNYLLLNFYRRKFFKFWFLKATETYQKTLDKADSFCLDITCNENSSEIKAFYPPSSKA